MNSFFNLGIENWFVKVKPMPISTYAELLGGVLLCIDDNEDVLECEKLFLESFGYNRSDRSKRRQGIGAGRRVPS